MTPASNISITITSQSGFIFRFGAVRGASYIEIATIGDIKRRNEERRAQLK